MSRRWIRSRRRFARRELLARTSRGRAGAARCASLRSRGFVFSQALPVIAQHLGIGIVSRRVHRSSPTYTAISSRDQSQIARNQTLSRESGRRYWTDRNEPVEDLQERFRRQHSLYVWTSFLASLRRSFVPSDWRMRPSWTRWKSGRGDEQIPRPLAVQTAAAPDQVVGFPRRTAAGAGSSSFPSASCAPLAMESPLVASRPLALHGASTIHSPSSMALARRPPPWAVQEVDLPDLLEVHPNGIVIPIMSAEIASSSSARLLDVLQSATSSTARVVGQLRRRTGDRVALDKDDLGRCRRWPRSRPEVSFFSSSSATATLVARDGRRPASLASSMSALPRRGRTTRALPRVACLGDRRTDRLPSVAGEPPRSVVSGAGRATGAHLVDLYSSSISRVIARDLGSFAAPLGRPRCSHSFAATGHP